MKITSSVEYSTRLMAALGRANSGQAMTGEKLSESENVPIDYVNQLLLRLKRAGLVQSTRGLRGGYRLAKPTAQISLGQIVRATEGKIFEGVCGKYEGGARDCRHQDGCGISPVWDKLGRMIEDYLDGVTLAELVERTGKPCAGAAGLAKMMSQLEA